MTAGEVQADSQQLVDRKKAFFDSLPEGEFTPEEENLRAALLAFLESWEGPGSPTLSQVASDPELRECRKALLPRKSDHHQANYIVSIKEWIERRIGGEVEVGLDSLGEVRYDFCGSLELLPREPRVDEKGKKRKAETTARTAHPDEQPVPVGRAHVRY